MKIFRVQMMTHASYNDYMMGGYNYHVEYYDVKTETEEQAVAIAKKENPDRFVNEYHVREVFEKVHTANTKTRLLERIARLEKELETAKKELKEIEERG